MREWVSVVELVGLDAETRLPGFGACRPRPSRDTDLPRFAVNATNSEGPRYDQPQVSRTQADLTRRKIGCVVSCAAVLTTYQ